MKPAPWWWVTRVMLSTGAVVAWGIENPHAHVWQLVLVAFTAIACLEGLRTGYQDNQERIRKRRSGRGGGGPVT